MIDFLKTYSIELACIAWVVFVLAGLLLTYFSWTYTGPRKQSPEELLKKANAVKQMSDSIAQESRENIKEMRRAV